METTYETVPDKTRRHFYQILGEIFYSVASTEKKTRKEELEKIAFIVRNEWLKYDATDKQYGPDYMLHIEMAFSKLAENNWDMINAIDHLARFKKDHPDFSTAVKMLILRTANAIATDFSGKNKFELVMLNEIEYILS